jgi:hypothetical protein
MSIWLTQSYYRSLSSYCINLFAMIILFKSKKMNCIFQWKLTQIRLADINFRRGTQSFYPFIPFDFFLLFVNLFITVIYIWNLKMADLNILQVSSIFLIIQTGKFVIASFLLSAAAEMLFQTFTSLSLILLVTSVRFLFEQLHYFIL